MILSSLQSQAYLYEQTLGDLQQEAFRLSKSVETNMWVLVMHSRSDLTLALGTYSFLRPNFCFCVGSYPYTKLYEHIRAFRKIKHHEN